MALLVFFLPATARIARAPGSRAAEIDLLAIRQARADCCGNSGHDAFDIAEDFVVPEANHPPPISLEIARAIPIGYALGMVAPVSFDDEPSAPAREISDKWIDPKLARESGPHAG